VTVFALPASELDLVLVVLRVFMVTVVSTSSSLINCKVPEFYRRISTQRPLGIPARLVLSQHLLPDFSACSPSLPLAA
jgi:hypothetical protein